MPSEAHDLAGEAPRLGSRVAENVSYLMQIHEWGRGKTAGYADINERTLRNLLEKPSEANPELKTIDNLARALGAEPYWLLLELPEMQQRIAEEGLRPFSVARPDTTRLNSGLVGSDQSAAGRRTRIRAKSRRGSTVPGDASNRRLTHNANDLHEWIRVPEEVCGQRRYSAHPSRPACSRLRVPEQVSKRQVA